MRAKRPAAIVRERCAICDGPNGRKHHWCKDCYQREARGQPPTVRATACRRGHPYVPGSYYQHAGENARHCRVCKRAQWHKYKANRLRREAAAKAEAGALCEAAPGLALGDTAA